MVDHVRYRMMLMPACRRTARYDVMWLIVSGRDPIVNLERTRLVANTTESARLRCSHVHNNVDERWTNDDLLGITGKCGG